MFNSASPEWKNKNLQNIQGSFIFLKARLSAPCASRVGVTQPLIIDYASVSGGLCISISGARE